MPPKKSKAKKGRGMKPQAIHNHYHMQPTPQLGQGFFEDVGHAFQSAHDWVKKNKVLSKVGKALGGVHPAFGYAGQAADALGYGKKRRHKVIRT